MKRIIALALTLILCVALVACGAGESFVIGNWSGNYIYEGNITSTNADNNTVLSPNDPMELTLSIYKGGACQIIRYDIKTAWSRTYTGTWELNDGVLVLSMNSDSGGIQTVGYEIVIENDSASLIPQGDSWAYPSLTKKN